MFHIYSIRIYKECDGNLRKNLQTERAFEDFFTKNISLQPSLGKMVAESHLCLNRFAVW